MCDDQRGNEKPAIISKNQLIDTPELKVEPEIKEDPLAMGDWAEFPASNVTGTEQSSVYVIDSSSDDDSVTENSDGTKFEIKRENTERKGKNSKASCSQKSAMNNPPNQHSLKGRKINRKKNHSRNVKKSINAKAQGKQLKKHECQQCEYSTKYLPNLKRHMIIHTGEKRFPCSRCSKRFTSEQHLRCHMKAHSNEFFFHCATCLQGFNEINEKLIHEGNCRSLRYECCFCKQSFGSQKSHLIRHMLVHSGEKPFACQQCSQRFTVECSLNVHMKRRHVKPRSSHRLVRRQGFRGLNQNQANKRASKRTYECYLCKKFIGARYSDLKRHMLQHSAVKPFRCEICLATFTRKNSLIFHLNFIHGGDKVMTNGPEAPRKEMATVNSTEASKIVESTSTSTICPANGIDSVQLPIDNEMDTSIGSVQTMATKQKKTEDSSEPSTMGRTCCDCIYPKNQQCGHSSAEPTLEFGYIWQNLDKLFKQMSQRDVNELNMKFIAQAFEKIENNQ